MIAFPKEERHKKLTRTLGAQNSSTKGDLQRESLPPWQSALKWGLREVQPGSTPSSHTGELPSPVLPGLTGPFPRCSISGSGRDSTVTVQ